MNTRRLILLSVIVLAAATVAASAPPWSTRVPATPLRRCEQNYDEEEIAEMQANGEDGYEPDDCPLLASTLTGPMLHNFCQLGDEDWVKFTMKPGVIYQIKAESPWNYPTEPHLELFDNGDLIAQNDHYFGNDAEIWWWNDGPARTVYVRATELRGRADCGNNEYTLSLHAFTDKP